MKNWIKKYVAKFAMPLVFLIGFLLLAYPSFSDYWNSFHQSQAIMSYSKSVSKMSKKDYSDILTKAHQYNTTHHINWNFSDTDRREYNQQLNFNSSGSMGYIEIPKINVKLSIFHGTDDSVLQTSIGHLEGTSLPVGGLGTHTVLSGHRGLPSAKLFSDLDKLREDDTFTLHVLNETMTYQVDQIRVVEPTDLSTLTADPNQDYCTLVTCTPYGINTHRLLVRGHRVPNSDGNADVISEAVQIKALYIAPFIAVPVCIVLIIYILVVTSRRYQDKHQNRAQTYLQEKGIEVASANNKSYHHLVTQLTKLLNTKEK